MRRNAPEASSVVTMPCMTTTLMFSSEPGSPRSRVSQEPTPDAILLATDGSTGSADAVIMAMAMARRKGIPLQVLTVVEALPLGLDADLDALPIVEFAQIREDESHHRVRKQILDLFGREEPIGINIEFGSAAETIDRLAAEWQARLIILGLGMRERAGEWGAGATARSVATTAPVATLAVAAGRWRIPRVIVVGMDFSEASLTAARDAVAITEPNAVLHLVHVRPSIDFPRVDARAWAALYDQGVQALFREITDELRALAPEIAVRTTLTSGVITDALRQAAVSDGADVIAVGRHGQSRLKRLWLGSVTTALLRDAPCSVLVTPARLRNGAPLSVDAPVLPSG
jgi:nucleotide-binding universal stress UspA family protein